MSRDDLVNLERKFIIVKSKSRNMMKKSELKKDVNKGKELEFYYRA